MNESVSIHGKLHDLASAGIVAERGGERGKICL